MRKVVAGAAATAIVTLLVDMSGPTRRIQCRGTYKNLLLLLLLLLFSDAEEVKCDVCSPIIIVIDANCLIAALAIETPKDNCES